MVDEKDSVRTNRLDARLNKSKHVKATNNVNDVDRRNEPKIKTRKTNVFNRNIYEKTIIADCRKCKRDMIGK